LPYPKYVASMYSNFGRWYYNVLYELGNKSGEPMLDNIAVSQIV
jgi:hypothetical protein